ncbi:hypothetical protein [Microbulbifer hydrolyticus]|uniref:Lipoprotein n=1 Tax=Microbulbifer hydrolyticus TaxID=48074 RepID=A0A6P1TEF1_9GAMM|nr:hypothetical protein [Microbulbifer hydrolyticus]MBB5212611.1 hypothetical protein [Microbulbifer hydrolyticus]QHQ40221.1 hypothetical protein GTQ55_15365 [Microbulbifer hydrolyticus]
MIKKLLAASGIVLVSACSTTPYENFDPTPVQGKQSLKFVSQVQQEEIVKEFVPSNAGGSAGAQFGLVGALVGAAVDASVNNSRAKDAESAVEPYRNATLDLNVRNMVEEAFRGNLQQIDWVADTRLVSEQLPEGTKVANYLPAVQEDLLLLVTTNYSLKPGAQVIEFTADYALYDKETAFDGRSKNKAKPVYKNSAKVQSYPHNGSIRRLTPEEQEEQAARLKQEYPVEGELSKSQISRNQKKLNKELAKLKTETLPVPGHDPAGGVWLANDAKLLRDELTAAPQILAKLIFKDLSGQYPLPVQPEGEKNKGLQEPQLLEKDEQGMVITRQPDGTLLSKYRYAPVYTLWGNVF